MVRRLAKTLATRVRRDIPSPDWRSEHDLSLAEFRARYEGVGTPVVIGGLAAAWPAMRCWNPESLFATCGDMSLFDCGTSEINGEPVLHNLPQLLAELNPNHLNKQSSKCPSSLQFPRSSSYSHVIVPSASATTTDFGWKGGPR